MPLVNAQEMREGIVRITGEPIAEVKAASD
jgi:hypothetical protein